MDNYNRNTNNQINSMWDALNKMTDNTPEIDLNGKEEFLAKKECAKDEDDARDADLREEYDNYKEANEADTREPYSPR